MTADLSHRNMDWLTRIGVLRLLLMLTTALVIATAPFADGAVHRHDWRLLPSVVAPSVMMMLVFAIPLDITMALIFMVDTDSAERRRLSLAIRLELAMLCTMLLAWAPFMMKVLDVWPLD